MQVGLGSVASRPQVPGTAAVSAGGSSGASAACPPKRTVREEPVGSTHFTPDRAGPLLAPLDRSPSERRTAPGTQAHAIFTNPLRPHHFIVVPPAALNSLHGAAIRTS